MTQEEALKIMKTGANVFLTGEPGSGKTHTINEYVRYLRERSVEPSITASTGIAATHIGGFTIHSWSGIGIKRNLSAYELDNIASNKRIYTQVRDAQVLIIDEVSMLAANTLQMIDAVCREIKGSHESFGGIQTILVGDFFQLPPIADRFENEMPQMFESENGNSQFAFHSSAWRTLNPLTCYLTEQHRQEDATFLELLSAIRHGEVSEDHHLLLKSRRAEKTNDGRTELYSHNANVDAINEAELKKLPGLTKTFVMEDRGPEKIISALKRGCLSPERLSLKIGAKVMFTKNDIIKHQFVNGTLGTVIGYDEENNYPIVETKSGRTIATTPMEWGLEDRGKILGKVIQIPLRLAWAMTVHKSQGMSLDAAHMDLSRVFEYGQGYVALSRLRTLQGLSISGLNARALEVHPEIREKDEDFREASRKIQEIFSRMNPDELSTMHKNFLHTVGGKEPVPGAQAVKTDTTELSKRAPNEKNKSTILKTLDLVKTGKSLKDIVALRNFTLETIITHLEKLSDQNLLSVKDLTHLSTMSNETLFKIREAIRKTGSDFLKPTFDALGGRVPYATIRLARLIIKLDSKD